MGFLCASYKQENNSTKLKWLCLFVNFSWSLPFDAKDVNITEIFNSCFMIVPIYFWLVKTWPAVYTLCCRLHNVEYTKPIFWSVVHFTNKQHDRQDVPAAYNERCSPQNNLRTACLRFYPNYTTVTILPRTQSSTQCCRFYCHKRKYLL